MTFWDEEATPEASPCAGCEHDVPTDQLCEHDTWPGPCCLDLCCPHHHGDNEIGTAA